MMARINVLGLFDGMSCGQIALRELGIKVDKYFASEIDKYAIAQTQLNFPKTIQIGDVTKVKVKLLCLSEVYSYICNYDSNLQSNISEWEVLYWLNKDFTLSAKIRTQKPNERQEVSEPSTVQRIKEVWFSNREMGSVRKFGDYTRSRRDGEENDIRTPQQLQCGKWWYDNDIYRRYKEENIGITIGKTKNGYSEKKNFGNIEGEVFKRRESESRFRENEKSNVEKRCSGELFERKREDRFSREVEKEKGNRRTKEGDFIDEVIRELCRWDESDGITQDYWSLLQLHKEEQITVVEYEDGFYLFKGRIDICIGGSPCQGFSFAGRQLNFNDPRSALFFEFVRILKEVRGINPDVKFLLENVRMEKRCEAVISQQLGVRPVMINSALVSAQNRVRLYWTNIRTRKEGLFSDIYTDIPQPQDKGLRLRDILEPNAPERYYLSDKTVVNMLKHKERQQEAGNGFGMDIRRPQDKACAVTVGGKMMRDLIEQPTCIAMRGREACLCPRRTEYGKAIRKDYEAGKVEEQRKNIQQLEPRTDDKTNTLTTVQKDNLINRNGRIRRLTPAECARLQTIPDWYNWGCSETQAYKMLGNGWTVEVIKHIFSFLNGFEKTNVGGEKINYGQISTKVKSENECSTCG